MKKIIAMLLSLCLVLAFAACSQKEEPSSEPEEPTPASEETVQPTDSEDGKEEEWDWEEGITGEKMTITNEDGFDQAGYVEIPTEKLGRYYFKANEASKNGNVTWTVYVMDEKFEDSYRYIPQAVEGASLEGDGYLDLEPGKYIYLYCSENGFTLASKSELTEGAACIMGVSEAQ